MWEEGNSTEKLFASDWPVGMSMIYVVGPSPVCVVPPLGTWSMVSEAG